MKIFLIGDYYSGTGPANVTQQYKNHIENILYQRMRKKAPRLLEMAVKILLCDVVLLSGHSKQNLYAVKMAKICHKKTAFLMHGCVEHENAINGVDDRDMTDTERRTMEGADAIYAVSEHFAFWLKEHYPQYADKISAVPNGIDLSPAETPVSGSERAMHRVISIGGGMPRKQIFYIAQAVMLLRQKSGFEDTELIVIGAEGLDTGKVNAYPCVKNLGLVPFERSMELLGSASLFVQNSCFETFGLAPLEALKMGDSLLLSKEVGALELFSDLREDDLIRNTRDPEEIAYKMKSLLEAGNHDRLLASIDTESVSWKKRSKLLVRKLGELAGQH